MIVTAIVIIITAALGGKALWKNSASIRHQKTESSQPQAAKTLYHCAMHPYYISDKPGNCPICGMELIPMSQSAADASTTGATGVHIDPTTVQNMGVRTEEVSKRDLRTEIRTNGSVKVDESRLVVVNARVMGYVEKLRVNTTGQAVRKGQVLLDIYSPDLVSAQGEFLQALRYAQGTGTSTGSQELVESSRRRLLNWGISESEIATLKKEGKARNNLSITSPANGVVLEKNVVEGENINPGMELYRIADLSRVWVVANVYQRDLAIATVGADAEVELAFRQGKPFRGKVTFLSPVLDPETKTAEVRIEITNTAALDLKPEMFATVRILSASLHQVLAVPEQSIIRSGRRTIAIVSVGGGYFEPRVVELGKTAGDYVEVLNGIEEGEKLVVSSQFLIDSESNLKAAIQQMQAPGQGSMSDSSANGQK